MAGLSPGCLRTEPFEPTEEAVTIGSVLLAGKKNAYLLASHPHRPRTADPPAIEATLSGPDWQVKFSNVVDPYWCAVGAARVWQGALACLQARLPEPIRELTSYTLAGTTELGPFSGSTTVPGSPRIWEPVDTVWTQDGSGVRAGSIDIRVRYETSPPVEAVVPDVIRAVQVTYADTTKNSAVSWTTMEVAGDTADITVSGRWVRPEFRFDLHLLGFERNYSRFQAYAGEFFAREPWPNFGLEGAEGVYGYFGAAARSRAVPVVVRFPAGG